MKNTFYSQGNPYNIVRVTGNTHTASVGELIIADETEITLPSGVPAGSVIAVRSSGPDVTTDVVGASDSVDGFSEGTTHQESKTGEYVYDGSDWYLRNSVDIRDGAIPDSAIWQYKFDETSGTSLNDDIGSNDGSLTNGSWTQDADLVADYGISFAGSGYITAASTLPELELTNDWSVAITVRFSSGFDGTIISQATGSSDRWGLGIQNSEWATRWSTDGSNFPSVGASVSPSTGVLYRVGLGWDSGTESLDIYVNGNNVTSGSNDLPVGETQELIIGARTDKNVTLTDTITDNPTAYNKKLSSSGWDDDYQRQPWS